MRIEMKLLPDEAERVWQALRETKLALGREMDATAVASPAPNLADAAVMMAEAQLERLDDTRADDEQEAQQEGETKPRRRPVAERRQLLVHLTADELEQGALRAELHDGTPLGGDTLLRLACDAGLVVAKTDGDGNALDVGRMSRTVNGSINRALLMRDRHCQWPGCNHDAFVEAHHLKHWAQGGETSLENLLLLCTRHHFLAHEGGFEVKRDADGALAFSDPDGRTIEAAPAPAPAQGDVVAQLTDQLIDRRTSLPRSDGTPLDLHAAVGALVWRQDRTSGADPPLVMATGPD